MGRRTTLKDVAKLAGVTSATVSYVINNTPGQSISAVTRDRVLDAVRTLNYRPNAHAKTLRSSITPCIGMVIRKNLAVPRFSQMAYGIQTRLEEAGYDTLLLGNRIDQHGFADYTNAYLAGRVAGVIFIGTDNQGPDANNASLLEDEHAPLVIFDSQTQSDYFSTVDFDYESGARLVTTRVLAHGCKHITYFKPLIDTAQERLREKGVTEACKLAQIPLDIFEAPVTLDNMEIWDARYSVGDTEEGLRLTDVFLQSVKNVLDHVPSGSAVISSWATWTHYFRKVESQQSSTKNIIYAELANNGESWLAADIYTRMPNYEAGTDCAEEMLNLINGDAPSARVIKLNNIVETITSTVGREAI